MNLVILTRRISVGSRKFLWLTAIGFFSVVWTWPVAPGHMNEYHGNSMSILPHCTCAYELVF